MTPPPSQPSVSVEETENGYIVHAGSAVATISKTILGYVVDADSQVLKEEYNLSPGVARTRKSIRDVMQFSRVPADNTLLILRASCPFFLLSQAVEMVCGFLPENFPEEDEWAFLSSWKNDRDVLPDPEMEDEINAVDEGTAENISLDNRSEELETPLSDVVSKVEDEVDAEFQSFSWTVKPGVSATKILDKTSFEHGETGIPKDVCSFFGADKLPAGSKIPILLTNNSRMFSGYIQKDAYTSERVRMRWDGDFTRILLAQRNADDEYLQLSFIVTDAKDTYEVVISASAESKKTEPLPSKNSLDSRQKLSADDVKKSSMAETLLWKHVEDSANRSYTSQIQEETMNSLQEKYKQIFAESCPNGITITNRLQLRKLSRAFQTVNPDFETMEKEEAFALVTRIVKEIGVFCGDNVWMPESAISINENILNKIITYISTNLETFPIVDIYLVYSHHRVWLPSSISSAQILNEILKQKLTKGYYFFENYVSNRESASWKPIIKRVLKEYLLSCGEAVHISQIEEEFPHASQNLLREILTDVNAGFVGGGRSQNYAHIGIFGLTDDVIKDIKKLLQENMDKNTSSITTERIEQIIHESYPELFSTYIDRNMLQEILEYYLSDVFEFRRGAVTLPGVKRKSATDIVIQHFRKKTIFTLQDVYDYIKEQHYSVAIMGVLLPLLQEHNFLRLDAQTFVSAKGILISNDIYENISVKLSHSLYRGYICSDKIADIFSYPFINEWPMNPYLLESIVRVHGSKMRPPLQVIDYYTGPEKPRGIIVKKNGVFQNHDDVIKDLLLKRHEAHPFGSVEEAIQFLKSEKYMERKTNAINEICKTILTIQ